MARGQGVVGVFLFVRDGNLLEMVARVAHLCE